MKTLIIGYGSIGARHTRLLSELGSNVAVVSKRNIDFEVVYNTIPEAIKAWQPKYVIVANKTHDHYDTLHQLAQCGYNGIVLVEKPLFAQYQNIPDNNFNQLFVAYNLRFHPILQKLQNMLQNETVISANIYVGQYLPNWRPETDYRSSYSASVSQGGGVLRDLSHELDYINWLFGKWQRIIALGGKYSNLHIDSDDVFAAMVETTNCPVLTLQLNYLDRNTRRFILINTTNHTIMADLVGGVLQIDDQTEKFEVPRDYTYLSQHKAIMSDDTRSVCTAQDGKQVMAMIAAAEQSILKKAWVQSEC